MDARRVNSTPGSRFLVAQPGRLASTAIQSSGYRLDAVIDPP